MVEVDRSPDVLVPKYRKINDGMVQCPLESFNAKEIDLDSCKKCRNFIRIEEGNVLCAISWI